MIYSKTTEVIDGKKYQKKQRTQATKILKQIVFRKICKKNICLIDGLKKSKDN